MAICSASVTTFVSRLVDLAAFFLGLAGLRLKVIQEAKKRLEERKAEEDKRNDEEKARKAKEEGREVHEARYRK